MGWRSGWHLRWSSGWRLRWFSGWRVVSVSDAAAHSWARRVERYARESRAAGIGYVSIAHSWVKAAAVLLTWVGAWVGDRVAGSVIVMSWTQRPSLRSAVPSGMHADPGQQVLAEPTLHTLGLRHSL